MVSVMLVSRARVQVNAFHVAEMLALSEAGDNEVVDMLVKDIYGQDYSKLGLKSTMIASSFGKVFKKGKEKKKFSPEDISKSLLYAVSNNIGQIAFVQI
jgi:type II pantothenate kinase